jgi:CubicO group peptidase (beta-lactamase class C family)
MWRYLAARKHDVQAAHAPEYSNLGFGVLGEALAARESLTYAALVQRDIAGPLAMRDTGITTAPEATSRLAKGHDAKLNSVAYWDLPAMPGAGALRSTARDMAAFVRAAQSGRLSGARASIQPRAVLGERRDIGLGWVRSQRGAQTIVWHNGGTGGFSSFAGFSESSGLGVVVLSNAAVSIEDIGVHLLEPTSPLASKVVKQGGGVDGRFDCVLGVAGERTCAMALALRHAISGAKRWRRSRAVANVFRHRFKQPRQQVAPFNRAAIRYVPCRQYMGGA